MKKIIGAIILVNLALAGGQMLLTAWRSSDGGQLAAVVSNLSEVQLANLRLRSRVYQLSALPVIEERARALQLTRGVVTQFLNFGSAVAQAPR